MLVKCRSCGTKIERDTAFKVTVGKVNKYYCSEEEYGKVVEAINLKNKEKELKDNTYQIIYDIFGYKITNTAIYKEINELLQGYTCQHIQSYLKENFNYLQKVMAKEFSSEYARIRYFSAILKNSLKDYKSEIEEKKERVITNIDIPKNKYKSNRRKKTLWEYEEEAGGEE